MAENKTSWPELMGADVDEAVSIIKAEQGHLTVQKMPQNSMMTMDFRENRVRVIYNEDTNKVTKTPNCG